MVYEEAKFSEGMKLDRLNNGKQWNAEAASP